MAREQEFPKVGYNYQLILKHLLEHAARMRPEGEIVYRDLFRGNYTQLYERCQRLSDALKGFGVKKGSKLICFEWNTHRFLEMYFAVPCMGAMLHMGNPLLTPEQMVYLINRVEDDILIFNKDFTSIIESITDKLKTVKHYIVLADDEKLPKTILHPISEYEELLRSASPHYEYPDLDEDTVASLSNTTGTTGDPKVAFFTHRQHIMHTLIWAHMLQNFSGERGLDPRRDLTIQLVPMFHAHGWGVPYMATFLGCKQVYPGRFDPKIFLETLKKEKRTGQGGYMACVATMLNMIISHPDVEQYREYLKGLIYEGGGMRLNTMLARKAKELGMDVCSGWGMTEVYTKVGLQYLKPHMFSWSEDKKIEFLSGTGMAPPFVEQRVVDEQGKDVPKDGKAVGEIVLRAPWLTMGYYKDVEKSKELWRDGWMHSGDMATIDEEESVLIIDRSKDVIKSGGEWISSLTLENLINMHPKVQEVAVFGAQSEKWGERPVVLLVPKDEYKGKISEAELKEHMTQYVEEGKILKWWIPDKFVFVDQIPRTSVGKFDKKVMRSAYGTVLEGKE
ncbi:MAG: long-chain-fatty-acid--CoA ligase [Deltaproteobacteria bacterium]|nr:long-chain-fatty-acid--CoA ligase [Deltaproteobacteria bacterium]MBW2341743.1 long-chain-fatty-acid--CoA ligase [Deltaproteobacteria bacterium]